MKTYQKMRPAEILADVREHGGTDTLMMAAYGSDADREEITALLLDAVAEEPRRQAHDKSQEKPAIVVIYLALFALYLFTTALFPTVARNLPTLACFIAPAVFCHVMYSLSQSPWVGTNFQERAAKLLADIVPDDHRTLGVLLDTLPLIPASKVVSFSPNAGGVMRQMFAAITPILWKAGDDLPLTLTEVRRDRLRGTLSALWYGVRDLRDEEADFCAAAIKALTLVGDTKSVKLLRRIAKGHFPQPAPGKAGKSKNREFLQSFATDCLTILHERNTNLLGHRRELRQLLHPRKGAIHGDAVDKMLKSMTNEVARVVLADYLCLTANPIFRLVQNNSDGSHSNQRRRIVTKQLDKWGDVRLLEDVLETVSARENSPVAARGVAKLLNGVVPGDSVYFSMRQKAILRRIVWERYDKGIHSSFSPALTAAAIYALGILGDADSAAIISRIQQRNAREDVTLQSVALDAIRRINDAKEWRESTK